MTMAPDANLAWVKNNLMAIAMALLAAYTGYLTAMTNVQNDVVTLRTDLARVDKTLNQKMSGWHEFRNEAAARVNFLCQQDLECRDSYDALMVPE
jgi:hypothetical protein